MNAKLDGHKVLNNKTRTKHRTSTNMGVTINSKSTTAEPPTSNHVVRKLQEPYKNSLIAGVNESMLSLMPLISWKLNIFKIIDGRISFYCNNLDLLPPKHKFTFKYLKKGIQEFHRKFVFAPQIRLLTMLWSFEKGIILTP